MWNFLKTITSGIDAISEWSGRILSYTLIVIMVVILFETISRYFFNAPTIWAHELCQILFGIYAILLGANALLHGLHVNMDLIYAKLSDRGKAIMDIITAPVFFIWTGLLLYFGGKFALDAMSYWQHSNTVWSPPTWEVKLAIPIAAFLLILQGTANLIRNIHMAVKGEQL